MLLDNIQLKLTQQAVKIRADIEVSCYTYEGIDAVKDALRAGIACSTDVVPIKINLIAPPLYVMTTSTTERAVSILGKNLNKELCPSAFSQFIKLSLIHIWHNIYVIQRLQDGLKILEDACKAVEEKIASTGGSFNFQMKPKVVTSTDEADLAKQLEKLEQENAEVIYVHYFHQTFLNRFK